MASIISQTASSSFSESPIIVNAQADTMAASASLKLVCDLYVWDGSSSAQPATPSFTFKKFPIGAEKKCIFDLSPVLSSYMTASVTDVTPTYNTKWFSYEIYEEGKNPSGTYVTSSHEIPTGKPFIVTDGYLKWGQKLDLAGSGSISEYDDDADQFPYCSSAPYVQTFNSTDVPFYFTLYTRGEGAFNNISGIYYLDSAGGGFIPQTANPNISQDIKRPTYLSRNFLKGREALGMTSFQFAPYFVENGSAFLQGSLRTVNFECQGKYDPIRIMWVNRFGGMDQFEFSLVSRKSISSETKTYNQNSLNSINGTYDKYKGITVYNSDAYESILVNTDYISEDNNVMFEELLLSKEIYLVETIYANDGVSVYKQGVTSVDVSNGAFLTPLTVESKNMTFKTSKVDKLVQYSMQFKYATPYKLKL